MKYLIAGRTGRGKDYLKGLLEEKHDWTFVLSATTREPRYDGEDTHVFLTHEQADAIPASEKAAVTLIDNGGERPDEYFATRKQVSEADGYIIDPKGISMLLKNMPDEQFRIVYVQADEKQARRKAIERAGDNQDAGRIFDARTADENGQFLKFERKIACHEGLPPNCKGVIVVNNDYSNIVMEKATQKVANMKKQDEIQTPRKRTVPKRNTRRDFEME